MGPSNYSAMGRIFRLPLQKITQWQRNHPKKSASGVILSALWHTLCYLDFLERVWRHTWFRSKKGIVIYDRYACDVYFRRPERWREILYIKLFPKPRFVFLCVGDPELIYQRKSEELTVEDIGNTIELYRKKLPEHNIPFVEINTTEYPSPELVMQAAQYLVDQNWFY